MAARQLQAGQAGKPCGLPRRLLAMLYDTLVVIALLMAAGALALPVTGDERQALRDLPYSLYLAGTWFAYFGWCWTRGGQTLGMRAWRIRIVDDYGGSVGWRQAAVRFGVSLLSAAALGAGFWLALNDRDRRTWHDVASATRLVRVSV